jgi:hypothetical protein
MAKTTQKVNKPKKKLPLHQFLATGGKPQNYKGAK